MTITEQRSRDAIELVISGRLDTGTSPELENKVKQITGQALCLYLICRK